MKSNYYLLLGFLLAGAYQARAQQLPLDTAVHTGKLANGFTYFIRHNEEPKNRVVMFMVNKVGSILEDDDQRGLAHFMEHMSFNGTTHFPKNELVDYLQKNGVRFGADINAYTSFDETVYQLPLPADKPEVVKQGLEIMHDWAHGATLDPAEIDKERGVVLEEKRLGKGAGERMRRQYFPVILNNSRYANRIPIGTDEILNNFKPATIRRFYDDWYRPDLQAIIVVGDIDAKQMEQMIKARFADLKNPAKERPRTKYTVPLTGKNQFIAVTDPEMTATTLDVMYKQPELPSQTAGDYREMIKRELFNMMINGRLGELSRQADPPFLHGSIAIHNVIAGVDAYDISVTARPGELRKGFEALWQENERLKRFGFTATEFERSKTRYLATMESILKEKDKTPSARFVNEYVKYFLQGTASPGITYEYQLVKQLLAKLPVGELNALAKTSESNRDILLLAPQKDKAGLPAEAEIMNWMNAATAVNIKPYVDDIGNEKLLAAEPVPGKIISKVTDTTNGTTMLKLSNGIRVLLKPTNFQNDQLDFNAFAPGGTSLYSDEDYQSAVAANMIPSFGAGNYNTTELNKYTQLKRIGIQTGIDERWETINGGSLTKDVEAELQLLYAQLTAPRKDSMQFKGIMARLKDGLANRSSSPASVFQDTVNAVLNGYNVRRTGLTVQKLEQINLDKAYHIYKERFADFSGFTFVFIGNIDTAKVYPLIEKYLASLPAAGQTVQAKDLHIHIPEGVITKTVYKGTEPRATVDLVFSGLFDFSFADKLKMSALNETLQIRLIERLREDESGVYSPNVSVSCEKLPEQRFELSVSFGCAPQNVDKLIASALDEIEKLKTTGPLQVNLDKFKAEYGNTWELNLKSNMFWQYYLTSQLQNGEDLNQYQGYVKTLNAITVDDVKAMAAKYLTGKNYIKLVLLPEKTTK